MSPAALSHEVACLTGVLVSPTTMGKPLTHSTRSYRRSSVPGWYVTSAETTREFDRGWSKSMSRTGTKSSVPTKRMVSCPRSQPVIRRFDSTSPSSRTARMVARRRGRTSSTRSGFSAMAG